MVTLKGFQGRSQAFLITGAIAKRRRLELLRVVWGHVPPENFQMETLWKVIFSVFIGKFPPNILKIQTNFNSIMFVISAFKILAVSFRNEILEAWKVISIRAEKKYQSRSSAPVQVWWSVQKCTLYLRPRFYLQRNLKKFLFSYDNWRPIFAIFATALEWCGGRMQGQGHLGGLCPLLICTTSAIGNKAGGCIRCTDPLEKLVSSRPAHKWSINWGYHT